MSNIIKFNPPPDGCSMCWKERKKTIVRILKTYVFVDYKIKMGIVGKCTADKKNKMERIIKAELLKMCKGWIEIEWIQL